MVAIPCQACSKANQYRRKSDPRHDLGPIGARVAVALQPRAILLENVGGFVSSPEAAPAFESVKRILKNGGYATTVHRVDAAHCGAAQRRVRGAAMV